MSATKVGTEGRVIIRVPTAPVNRKARHGRLIGPGRRPETSRRPVRFESIQDHPNVLMYDDEKRVRVLSCGNNIK
jgi:hypothetical protein